MANAGGRAVHGAKDLLGPRTAGAWTLADGSDQTFTGLSAWTVGGDVDLLNTAIAADEGVAGRLDKVFNFANLTRLDPTGSPSSVNYHKWIGSGTTADGVHDPAASAEAKATQIKAWYAQLEAA